MHWWFRNAIICSTLSVAGCQTITDVSGQMNDIFTSLTGDTESETAPNTRLGVPASTIAPKNPGQLTGELSPKFVHSGDSFTLKGTKIALFGIDALEPMQTCDKTEMTVPCGEIARNALIGFTAGHSVTCTPEYFSSSEKKWISQCTIGNFNLSLAMVLVGFATTSEDHTQILSDQQKFARQQKRGMWGTRFEAPSTWRSMHPTAIFSPQQN